MEPDGPRSRLRPARPGSLPSGALPPREAPRAPRPWCRARRAVPARSPAMPGASTQSAVTCSSPVSDKVIQRTLTLFVRLTAGGADFRTPIALNRTLHLFNYRFVVPTSALSGEGIVVSVADADDDDPDGRMIGSSRLELSALLEAARTGSAVALGDAEHGIGLLEVLVIPRRQEIARARRPPGAKWKGFDRRLRDRRRRCRPYRGHR